MDFLILLAAPVKRCLWLEQLCPWAALVFLTFLAWPVGEFIRDRRQIRRIRRQRRERAA